jgi:hypothetical protein
MLSLNSFFARNNSIWMGLSPLGSTGKIIHRGLAIANSIEIEKVLTIEKSEGNGPVYPEKVARPSLIDKK